MSNNELKTASELALEYWNKPPIERVNNTLQDYVYSYMEQQNKRNEVLRLIQEAEIARLRSGFDELMEKASEKSYFSYEWNLHGVRVVDLDFIEDEIKRITESEQQVET